MEVGQQGNFGSTTAAGGPPQVSGSCRVYVGNLAWKTKWQELKDHMRQAGNVQHASILMEPAGRSKGCGIVEYETPEEARAAIEQLTDTELGGRTIFVREDREQMSGGTGTGGTGGSGVPSSNTRGAGGGPSRSSQTGNGQSSGGGASQLKGGSSRKGQSSRGTAPPTLTDETKGKQLFISNLSWNVGKKELEDSFREFGQITNCDVCYLDDGRSKGLGYVVFDNSDDAQKAIDGVNDRDVGGRRVTVRLDQGARGGRQILPQGGQGGGDIPHVMEDC